MQAKSKDRFSCECNQYYVKQLAVFLQKKETLRLLATLQVSYVKAGTEKLSKALFLNRTKAAEMKMDT